ncbi:MAG: hypothetical protein Aurels2KO_56000 [Aureliella sp.]
MKKYISKVLLDSQVAARLTGFVALNARPTELWSIRENETGTFVCENCRDLYLPVPQQSTEFARLVSVALSRLFSGLKAERWLLSLNTNGDLVETATTLVPNKPFQGQRGQRLPLTETGRSYNLQLHQGVELSVWNPSGELALADIVNFLEEAMGYFKERRSHLGENQVWAGPDFAKPIARGRHPLGRLGLWLPNPGSPERLSLDEWCTTVVTAFCIATTVAEFQKNVLQFLEQNDSPELAPVFDALQSEANGIHALELMLKRKQAFQ